MKPGLSDAKGRSSCHHAGFLAIAIQQTIREGFKVMSAEAYNPSGGRHPDD